MVGEVTVSEELREPFLLVLGVLTTGVAAIMQFWFGSSYGSKEKTAGMIGKK